MYGSTGGDYLIWGAQVEALPFASSYIRTEGSTVSRAGDSILINSPSYLPKQNENQTVHIEFNVDRNAALGNSFLYSTSETANLLEVNSTNKINYFGGGSVISGSSSPNNINNIKCAVNTKI